jgi:tetratricopeptide (TPR) repeat protein
MCFQAISLFLLMTIKHIYLNIFIFLSFTLSAQTAKEFSEMASSKIENKDYRNALEFINRAIQLNDTNQWYPIQKAEIEFKLYGPTEALSVIFKAMPLNRKNSEFYNRAGIYYESGGIADSAIYMYNMAIRYAKSDTIKYAYILNRGTARAGHRDFEGARVDYEKVLEFNPNDIGTLNNIANVYRELKMPNKGIESLKKIIKIDPSFIGPYINLGFAYLQLDSLDLSIKYFDEALKIDPNEALVYSNRGNVYYKLKNYSAALKDINYSISLYPSNSYAYRNLALVYIATNKMSEACETLKFADYYGFEQRYGDEVKNLRAKHCK